MKRQFVYLISFVFILQDTSVFAQGIGRPGAGIGRPTSGVGRSGNNIGQPGSGVERNKTNIGNPGSGIGNGGSNIGQPGSGIGLSSESSIGNPGVGIGTTTSSTGRPGSGIGRGGSGLHYPDNANLKGGSNQGYKSSDGCSMKVKYARFERDKQRLINNFKANNNKCEMLAIKIRTSWFLYGISEEGKLIEILLDYGDELNRALNRTKGRKSMDQIYQSSKAKIESY